MKRSSNSAAPTVAPKRPRPSATDDDEGEVLVGAASAAPPAAALPTPSVTLLMRALFPGVSSAVLAQRVARPMPLGVAAPLRGDVAAQLERARASAAAAMKRRARSADRSQAARTVAASAPAAPAAFFALSTALAPPTLALQTACGRRAPDGGHAHSAGSAKVKGDSSVLESKREKRLRRFEHGWAPTLIARARQTDWRSTAYIAAAKEALRLTRAGHASDAKGPWGARGASLSDLNDALRIAARAERGWADPTQSARAHRMAVLSGGGGGGGSGGGSGSGGPLGSAALPQSLSSTPDHSQLFSAALVGSVSFFGAKVSAESTKLGDRSPLLGVVTWVGQTHMTVAPEDGKPVTVRKDDTWVTVEWPTAMSGRAHRKIRIHARVLSC